MARARSGPTRASRASSYWQYGIKAPARPGLRAPAQERNEAPTFSRDIAPIVFEHCAVCHRPGGPGPMSLLSYSEVRPWARAINEQVSARRMPPWKAEAGHGGPFVGDRRLTDNQVALIQRWVADGTVEGTAADLPPVPSWPDGGWRLGKPDLVLEMTPYVLPAGGQDVLRKFAIPIPVAGTRFVRGIECLPGNARVVHHAIMRIDATRASRALDDADPEAGYEGVTPFAAASYSIGSVGSCVSGSSSWSRFRPMAAPQYVP